MPVLAAPKLDPALADKARRAVDRGLDFLRSRQEENGSYGNHVGLTAMALQAFAESPHRFRDADGPFIARAAAWLVGQQRADGAITGDATPTYNTALAIMALHALDPAKYAKAIAGGQRFLVRFQIDEDQKFAPSDKSYGGIGYGGDERPDLSNLVHALDALRQTDYDPNSDVWAKAQKFVTRCQNRSESNDQPWAGDDGGFVYEPGNGAGAKSYGAMTFAGLKSLIFTRAAKDDPRVVAAWAWVRKNYDFGQHPGLGTTSLYYYYQSAATALDAYGERMIPDDKGRQRDWAADLAARLVALQRPDGSWVNDDPKYWEGNPLLATSRAVSSLNHALRAGGAVD
jgi:squalene-hopene/tetraprenyl-beta-curcumene cyclase